MAQGAETGIGYCYYYLYMCIARSGSRPISTYMQEPNAETRTSKQTAGSNQQIRCFPSYRPCPCARAEADTDVYLVLVRTLMLLLLAGPLAVDNMMLGWEASKTAGAA